MLRGLLEFGRRDGFAGIFLDIRFFDATEEGGHSLSPEKFAKQRRYWFQVGLTIILLLCY